MLSIKDLQVSVEDKEILRGLSWMCVRGSARDYGAQRFRQKYAIRNAGRT